MRMHVRATALWMLVIGLALPAASGVVSAQEVHVNFQDPPTLPPLGYVRDSGEPYGPRSGPNQGSGLTYGWVVPGSSTPLDLSIGGTTPGNGRNRGTPVDVRLATLMHMQADDIPGSFNGTKAEGWWEIAVANGAYEVTVAAGDGGSAVDSVHQVNVESQAAIAGFVPTTTTKFGFGTVTVTVSDGRLTLSATGGTNTKIDYVDIVPAAANRPYVTGTNPSNATADVSRDIFVAGTVGLPNPGGIDGATLTAGTVKLLRVSDSVQVGANLNTTGGGDAIVLQPTSLLDANTQYMFVVTSGLEDIFGNPFLPYTMSFTTGTAGGPGGGGPVAFTKVVGVATGEGFTVLEVGPDGKLYGATIDGKIVRWTINGDGTLSGAQTITSIQTANGGDRAIIGLRFDPAASAGNLILWVTHSGAQLTNSPDWLGKITRLSGPNLATVQDYVVNLPRSTRDHMTNGIDFKPGEPTVLYVQQGSNSAMGAPDNAWGNRLEHMLNAATLRVDLAAISSPPLNVKTDEGGTYDPFAPGAPLTVFGSGTRNCYDLVWHTNGQLYVPCNGSAAGGNTPATPGVLPAACSTRRLDLTDNGPYTGPAVPGLTNAGDQHDFLFRIVDGGYYGHPNPTRCEWAMNGANPTAGADPAQVSNYAVGVQPDRNYRGFAFDFGLHYSPDGIIEYRSTAFAGALQGKLLVTRYSGGDDIIVLTPGGANLDIVSSQTGITGMTGFTDPLGIAEDVATGNLYVTELGAGRVTLLRANTPPTGCVTAADCSGTLPACGVFACNAGACEIVPGNAGLTCRGAATTCDAAEVCSGASTGCPPDLFAPATTPCRGAASACDATENCTGTSATCPADGFAGAGTECREAAGLCDVAEVCTGSSPTCPPNLFAPGGVCRAAVDAACDLSETCSGVSALCPPDAFAAAGTACASDGNACTDDQCSGAGACAHAANSAPCSDGDACTSPDQCAGGSCSGGPALGGQSCATGQLGACAAGTTTCSAGTVSCVPDASAQPEVCGNSVDEDCDGALDDADACPLFCAPPDTVSAEAQTKRTVVRLSAQPDHDKVITKGTFVLPSGSPPLAVDATTPVSIGVSDGAAAFFNATVAGDKFGANASGSSLKFKDTFKPYESGGLQGVQFKIGKDGRTVKYRVKAQGLNLPDLQGGTGTVTIKIGDRCFVDAADTCTVGTGMKCQ